MPASARLLLATLKAMHASRVGAMLSPLTGGVGVVFTLHHVRPGSPPEFAPNRILTITPQFLDQVIGSVLEAGYDVVRLDEIPVRLQQAAGGRPFACFTFDDGYRDNRDHALPVFERYGLPMAIYIATEFADGRGDFWWLALEEAIRRLASFEIEIENASGTTVQSHQTGTAAEKTAAFQAVYWWLRMLPEQRTRSEVARLCRLADYDPGGLSCSLAMGWDELRELASHPLVTLGAHTIGHWALARLPELEARRQIAGSVRRLATETGQPCRHFSFPYGDAASAGEREFRLAREAGLRTAVTTQKSLLHARHRDQLTGLPRLSLNGDFQDTTAVEALLTGAPFALLAAAERLGSVWSQAPISRSAASSR